MSKLVNAAKKGTVVGILAASFAGLTPMVAFAAPVINESVYTGDVQDQTVTTDKSALEAKVKEAQAAGINVTVAPTQTEAVAAGSLDSRKAEIEAEYAKKISDIDAAIASQKEHQAAVEAFNRALEAYNQAKAASVSGDIYTAQRVDKVYNEQPFSLVASRNSLEDPGNGFVPSTSNFPPSYSSDVKYLKHVRNGDSVTLKWKGAAQDKATGRALDVTIVVSDIVTADNNQELNKGLFADPYVMAYSNYNDNIALGGVVAAKETINISYSDDGSTYDKDYYVTYGSLNAAGKNGERFEMSAPANSNIKASYLSDKSLIKETVQPVYGNASSVVSKAFMVDQASNQGGPVSDENNDALSILGVTYLTSNGGAFWVGTSGSNGQQPKSIEKADNVTGGGRISASFNHIMLSADTVAPVAPPPTPVGELVFGELNVNYTDLVVKAQGVTKVGDAADKKVLAGQVTTQRITHTLGAFNSPGGDALNAFALSDFVYYTEDGRLPVDINLADIRVSDAQGTDLTGDFTLSEDDSEFEGKKVHRIFAEAKNPGSLKAGETYTMLVKQTAKSDGVADKEVDRGGVIINGKLIYTDPVTYTEVVPAPKKEVKTTQGTDANSKQVLPGDEIVYNIRINAADLKDTQTALTALGARDNYDETFFAPAKDKLSVVAVGADGSESPVPASDYTVSWDDAKGEVTVKFNDPEGKAGSDYIVKLPGTVSDKVGEFKNVAVQITNDAEAVTNEVTNNVPPSPNHKDVTNKLGVDANDKRVLAGDVVNYPVVADTSKLVDTAYPVSTFVIGDNFDETKGEALTDSAKVVQVSGDTDTSNLDAINKAVAGGKDVTSSFDIANDGMELTATMKKNEQGTVVLPVGNKYILVMPFQVSKNLEGTGAIINTAYHKVNNSTWVTNRVQNPYDPVVPVKFVTNLAGTDVNTNLAFAGDTLYYPVVSDSSTLTNTAYDITSYGIVDNYDETKGAPRVKDVKVYQVPGDVDQKSINDVENLIKAGAKDVSANFTVTDNGTELEAMMTKDAAGKLTLPMGFKYVMVMPFDVKKDLTGSGEIVNTATQVYNDQRIETNKVTNPYKPITPTKFVTNTGGTDVNDKRVFGGDLLHYPVVADTTELEKTVNPVTTLGIVDSYDTEKGAPVLKDVKVYQVPGDVSSTDITALENAVHNGAKDVTDSFNITDDGTEVQALMKTKSADDPTVVLPMGFKYVMVMPYQVKSDLQGTGTIKNIAAQITNQNRFVTNEVHNPFEPLVPVKFVTDKQGANVDGKRVFAEDTVYYPVVADTSKLTDTAYKSTAMAIVDDYDETKGDAIEADAKVYQIPGTVDDKNLDEVNKAIAAGGDKANVTKDFTITDKDGVVTAAMNTDENKNLVLPMGYKYVLVLPFTVSKDIQGAGVIPNVAAQIHNQNKYSTNQVSNPYSPLTPLKYVTDADGHNVDGKHVLVGDKLYYPVVADTAELDKTVYTSTAMGIVDDYDESKVTADVKGIKVYQLPGDVDRTSLDAVEGSIKSGGVDVTDKFTLSDEKGIVTATMNKKGTDDKGSDAGSDAVSASESGELVLPMGYTYVMVLPVTVKSDLKDAGEFENTATQIHNKHKVDTNKVKNTYSPLNPHKTVVTVDGTDVDGKTIPLGSDFYYTLTSTERPAGYGSLTTQWSLTDDFDEKHDTYKNTFTVVTTTGYVDANGNKVEKGTDITQYFTQKYDESTATVVYEANQSWLDLMNTQANRDTAQGFAVKALMNRHAPADKVENKVTESYNTTIVDSNVVHTDTPAPAAPLPPVVQGIVKTGGEVVEKGAPWAVLAAIVAGAGAVIAGKFGKGRKTKSEGTATDEE